MDEVTGHHIFSPPFHLTLLLDFQNNTSKNPVCIVISKSWYVCLKASQNDLRMHGHRLEDILPIPFWQNEGTHQWSLQFRSTYSTKSVSAVRYTFVVVFLFVFLDGFFFLASCNMNEQTRHLLHLTGTIGPLLFNLPNSKHPDWTNYCGWLAVCTQSLLINNWTNYCIQWVKRLKGYLCIIMATYDANSDINEDSQPFDVSSCWNQKCREGRSKEEGNVNGEGKKLD